MLDLFSGTPGSGKSLHAAQMVRDRMNVRGYPVVANFPLGEKAPVKDRSLYHYVPNSQLTPVVLMSFADEYFLAHDFSEDTILCVLDECQVLWNARSWSDKGSGRGDSRMDWLEFFSQHRKYGYRIVLIAQSSKMVDNQFRMLIEREYRHFACKSQGLVGGFLNLVTFGRAFMVVRYLYAINERLGMDFFIRRKADCLMYDSYARFDQISRDVVSVVPDPSA